MCQIFTTPIPRDTSLQRGSGRHHGHFQQHMLLSCAARRGIYKNWSSTGSLKRKLLLLIRSISLLVSPAQISFSNLIHCTPALRSIILLNPHSGVPALLNHSKHLSPIFLNLYFLDDSVLSEHHLYCYFLNVD